MIRAIPALEELKLKGDEQIGSDIVKRALEEPLRQLADNAGQEGSLVVQELKSRKGWEGFDVDKLEYVDMGKAGSSTRPRSRVGLAERREHRRSVADHRVLRHRGAGEGKRRRGGPPGRGGMGGMDY